MTVDDRGDILWTTRGVAVDGTAKALWMKYLGDRHAEATCSNNLHWMCTATR